MQINVFTEAKERLDIVAVAQRYGIAVNRHGKALCPFHNEKTPSFTLYPASQSFHCFGCGASGDVIKLTSRLLGLTAMEAIKRLNEDFFLQLPLDKSPDKKQRAKQLRERQDDDRLYEGFKQWKQAAFLELREISLRFREDLQAFSPLSQDVPLPPHIVTALQNRERVEYLLDVLMGDYLQDKIQLYKSREVERMVKACQKQKISAS